jgi:hypothetical protein
VLHRAKANHIVTTARTVTYNKKHANNLDY